MSKPQIRGKKKKGRKAPRKKQYTSGPGGDAGTYDNKVKDIFQMATDLNRKYVEDPTAYLKKTDVDDRDPTRFREARGSVDLDPRDPVTVLKKYGKETPTKTAPSSTKPKKNGEDDLQIIRTRTRYDPKDMLTNLRHLKRIATYDRYFSREDGDEYKNFLHSIYPLKMQLPTIQKNLTK